MRESYCYHNFLGRKNSKNLCMKALTSLLETFSIQDSDIMYSLQTRTLNDCLKTQERALLQALKITPNNFK